MKKPRLFLYLAPLSVFLLLSFFWLKILKPFAIEFIKEQIPKVNQMQNSLTLKVEDVDLSLLNLSLHAKNIQASFSKDLVKPSSLNDLNIKNLQVQLDPFYLIIGQIQVAKIIVHSPSGSMRIVDSGKKFEAFEIPINDFFELSRKIPIERILVFDPSFQIELKQNRLNLDLKAELLNLRKSSDKISITANKIYINTQDANPNKNTELEGLINLDLALTQDDLTIQNADLKLLNTDLKLKAQIFNPSQILLKPRGQLQFGGKINLLDIKTLLLTFAPQKNRLPALTGIIEHQGQLKLNNLENITGQIDLKTSQVSVDHFKLGQAEISANFDRNHLQIKSVDLEHPSGQLSIKNLKIENKSPYKFSAKLNLQKFDLQKFFLTIDEPNIPVGLSGSGDALCEGLFNPNPTASCLIQTELQNLWVKPDLKDDLNIIKIKQGELKGSIEVNKNSLSYKTNISINESSGSSSGEIEFDKGFEIYYETESLDLRHIETLAGMKLSGILKIAGSTSGNSDYGVMNAQVQSQNTIIENFNLGQITSEISYAKSKLIFRDLKGQIGKTAFTGDLNFDFDQSTLDGSISSQKLYAEDTLSVFANKFNIQFPINGSGQAEAFFKGPFDFWKMSYRLNTSLSNGSIAGEKFKNFEINLNSDGEHISFNKFKLQKTKTDIDINGTISTQNPASPIMDLTLKANPFLLEEIDHIISFAPVIAGTGFASGEITGPISNPKVSSNFTLKQVSYDKVDYPNSQGKIVLDKNYLLFNGQFFGRQIQTDIMWPWSKNDPFSMKLLVHELNPLYLLPIISLPQPNSDYFARLNAEVDLKGQTRDFSKADGAIKLSQFILQRGNQFLKLTKPSNLFFKSGLTEMNPLLLKADDSSFLKIEMNRTLNGHVRLNTSGDLQLRLFHFLVPFTQSLSGNLILDTQLLFKKDDSFELFGEGELNKAQITLKGFPQAIENINTPIEFSKSKIFLNDITGQLGLSDVTGLGQIDIQGSKNIIVNLKAIADNVELNFPEKIFTSGKANVLFSGNWLPYKLKVDYKVNHGLLEKDFEKDDEDALNIKASSYLPEKQFEDLSPSLNLDVNIDLSNGIIVKNSILDGEARGNLQILGSPEIPQIHGQIEIKPKSKLFFKDKPFEVQNATIKFDKPKEINPDIYILANSRISDYDINLLVRGAVNKLDIKPTSQPPLSEPDIFSLIALGVTSKTEHTVSSDTQQRQTGIEVITALGNQSRLNKKLQQKLGLVVQLAPSIDSTKNIAVPKVVVSKKISDKFNATYSKPFTGTDQNQEIKLQYLWNSKVSFLLNYQNKDSSQQEQINSTESTQGIWGLDLEYRDDFR